MNLIYFWLGLALLLIAAETFVPGARVTQVTTSDSHAEVHYTQDDNGVRVDAAPLKAPLVVAADSRFSAVRRMLGVGTQMTDFGRSVIVCRMRTSISHEDKAHECFGYDRTLAILPVQPDPDTGELLCSAVVTTDSADAQQLMQLSPEDFAAHVQNHFQSRLGDMQLVGERHIYPLVATYAHRFSGERFALLGDAAVGMHPVTAHGYNLGLSGVERLTACMLHQPRLLLLDEPTAGVDPKARRDFWEEIHTLAADGMTVLVSTHYMDEAERCHRLGYIAYGRLLACGTPAELIANSGLHTWQVSGQTQAIFDALNGQPGVDLITRFGNTLHLSGQDEGRLIQAITPWRQQIDTQWQPIKPQLEDLFIRLMQSARDNFTDGEGS